MKESDRAKAISKALGAIVEAEDPSVEEIGEALHTLYTKGFENGASGMLKRIKEDNYYEVHT